MVLLLFVASLNRADAGGAGRAFPIDSENYVTEQFDRINSRLVRRLGTDHITGPTSFEEFASGDEAKESFSSLPSVDVVFENLIAVNNN